MLTHLMAQDYSTSSSSSGAAAGVVIVFGLIGLVFAIFFIAVMWKLFTKAGEKGWKAIIPIWSTIVLLRIAGRPWWWFLLMLIPIVNIVIYIIVSLDLAKAFGKGAGFGIGIFFLGFIFLPILAFGSAQYRGRAGTNTPWAY